MIECVCGKHAYEIKPVSPTGRKLFVLRAYVCICGRLYPLGTLTAEQKNWVDRWNKGITRREKEQSEW